MWKTPHETPKDNTEVIFYLYIGEVKAGIFNKDRIIDSHKNEYKMYQIKKWCSIENYMKNIIQNRKQKVR